MFPTFQYDTGPFAKVYFPEKNGVGYTTFGAQFIDSWRCRALLFSQLILIFSMQWLRVFVLQK